MTTTVKPPVEMIATGRNDTFIPVFGGLLRPQDDVLIRHGGGLGLRIYDELERDPRVLAVTRKRKLAVVARAWTVDPADGSRAARKAADLVKRALAGFDFDRLTEDLLDAVMKGFAVAEVMWEARGAEFMPVAIEPRDQRRFVFDVERRLRLLTPDHPSDGIELPDRKFVIHRCGDKTGDPYGLGLGSALFWPCWFKRQGAAFWATYTERFGSPTPVAKVDDMSDDDKRRKMLDQLLNLANENALVVNKGWEVEFLEAARSGGVTYPDFVRYWDDKISEAVLGETLTTNIGDTGSRAASDTHNDVRRELTTADADLLCGALNAGLVRWIVDVNLPGAPYPTIWRPDPELDIEADAARSRKRAAVTEAAGLVQAVRAIGFVSADPSADLVAQADGQWLPAPVAPPPTFAAAPAPRDDIDDMVDQLDAAAGPAMDAMIDTIRALLDDCGSLDEFAHRLAASAPDLDGRDLAAIVENALVAADLGGRVAIAEGTTA